MGQSVLCGLRLSRAWSGLPGRLVLAHTADLVERSNLRWQFAPSWELVRTVIETEDTTG